MLKEPDRKKGNMTWNVLSWFRANAVRELVNELKTHT